MRISLIHGEDTKKAYDKYRQLVDGSKTKGFEIIPVADIRNVVSQSLFEERIVFTLEKANKIKLADWKWLAKNGDKYNSNLLIYFEGSAPATVIKSLPKDAKSEKFDLPKIIFQFLDSLYPGNFKNSLRLLNELSESEPTELVMHLTARHFRDLYWTNVSSETFQAPSWRIKKIAQQSGKFGLQKLASAVSDLALIDVDSKTGGLNLKSSLDLFILKHLE